MSQWPCTKAKFVLQALKSIGWLESGRVGSHLKLTKVGHPNYIFAFHEGDEIGPRMLARIAKHTGLTPKDL